MLGDLVSELQGQITSQRVLPGEHGLPPTVETAYQASGELLGVPIFDMGTYVGNLRADGTLYGHGEGIVMSPTGAKATWKGHGVGQFQEGGVISWRGSVVYESDSDAFAALRGTASVFEWQTEQGVGGKVGGKLWAWK